MFGFGKKAKVENESIDSEFNLDDGLDMGGFDFDADPMKDDRKPVTKVLDGALTGLKSGVSDTSFLKKTVKDILPEGYGKTMDLHDKVNGSIRDLYDETAKEVKPAIKEFKKISARLIPSDSKFVPAPVQDLLQKWRDEKEEEKRDSALDENAQKEQFLSIQMADIFQAQTEDKQSEKKEKDAKENIQQGIDLERHRDLLGIVSNMDQSVSRIDQYGRSVGLNYQKKTLELMYRQLFALQDLVKLGEKGFGIIANELPAIKKNTALPEFVKQTNTEFLKEYNKKKLVETIGRNLFGTGAEYLDKVLGNFNKNLKAKFKEGIGQFKDTLTQAGEAHDSMKDLGDMPGMDKSTMVGSMAGDAVGKGIGGKAAKWVQKNVLSKSERVNKLGTKLLNASVDAPRAINEFREKNANATPDTLWGKMKSGAAGLISPFEESKSIEGQDATKLNNPSIFTKRTDRSINEVIPGFLARILREIKVLRTGNEDIELEAYDHVKNTFTDKGKLEKRIFDSVIDSRSKDSMHGQLDEMIKSTEGEELSAEAKKALKKRLTMTSASGKRMSKENFDQEDHYEGPGAAEAAAHMQKYFEKNKDNEGAHTAIKRKHDSLGSYVTNTMGHIESNAELGYTEELQKAGFLEQDGKSISRDKIIEYYLNQQEKTKEAPNSGPGNPPAGGPGPIPPAPPTPNGGPGGVPPIPPTPNGGPGPTPPTPPTPNGGPGGVPPIPPTPNGGPGGVPPIPPTDSGLGGRTAPPVSDTSTVAPTSETFVGPQKPKTKLQRLAGSISTDIGNILEGAYNKGSSAVKSTIEVLDSKDPKEKAIEKLVPKKLRRLYKDGLLDRQMVIQELKTAAKKGGRDLQVKMDEIKQLNKDGALNIENLALIAQGKPPKKDATQATEEGAPDATLDTPSEKPKAFAKGGVFSNQVLDKATPFSFEEDGKTRPAVAGEAGPEAVMPLTAQGVRAVDGQGNVQAHLPLTRDKNGILSVENTKSIKDNGKKAFDAVSGFFTNTKEALQDIIADKAHELKSKPEEAKASALPAAKTQKPVMRKGMSDNDKLLFKLDELIEAVKQSWSASGIGSAVGSTVSQVSQSAFTLAGKAKTAAETLMTSPKAQEFKQQVQDKTQSVRDAIQASPQIQSAKEVAKKKFEQVQKQAQELKKNPKLTELQANAGKKLEQAKKLVSEAKLPSMDELNLHVGKAKKTVGNAVGQLKTHAILGAGKLQEHVENIQKKAADPTAPVSVLEQLKTHASSGANAIQQKIQDKLDPKTNEAIGKALTGASSKASTLKEHFQETTAKVKKQAQGFLEQQPALAKHIEAGKETVGKLLGSPQTVTPLEKVKTPVVTGGKPDSLETHLKAAHGDLSGHLESALASTPTLAAKMEESHQSQGGVLQMLRRKLIKPVASQTDAIQEKSTRSLEETQEHSKVLQYAQTLITKKKNTTEEVKSIIESLVHKKALTLENFKKTMNGEEVASNHVQAIQAPATEKKPSLKEQFKSKAQSLKVFGEDQLAKTKEAYTTHRAAAVAQKEANKPAEQSEETKNAITASQAYAPTLSGNFQTKMESGKKNVLGFMNVIAEQAQKLADTVKEKSTNAVEVGKAFVNDKMQGSKAKEAGGAFKERDEITGDIETVLRKNLHGIQITLDKSEDHLSKILKAIEEGGSGSGGKRSWWPFGKKDAKQEVNHGTGVSGLVGRTASGATSLAGKGLGLAARTFGKTAMMNVNAIKWAGKKILPGGPKEPKDIYVEGESRPRLYAARIKEGLYLKKISKKPLVDIKDLNEPIVDQEGNELLTEDDLKKVYVKSIGGKAKKLAGGIGKIGGAIGRGIGSYAGLAKKIIGFEVDMVRGGLGLAKKAVSGAYGLMNGPADVYTPGIEDPVMVATVMKHGGYISKLTGKVISKPTDIDGPVVDKEGNTVLTTDQLRKGIFNAKGKKFKTPLGKLLGVAGKVAGTVWGVQKAAWGLTKKIGSKMLGGLKGLTGGLFDGLSVEINGAKSVSVLTEIKEMLKSHFASSNKAEAQANKPDITKNEKGFKIGSWQDLKLKAQERLKEKKDKLKGALGGVEKVKNKLINPFELFQDLKGLVTGTLGKITGLIGGVKDLFSLGKGASGKLMGLLGKLGKIGGFAARLLPMAGGLASGAVGALGALGSGAAAAATGIAGAAGTVASAGAGMMGAIAGGAGALGAGLLSFLASPVVLGVAAVAIVGYGGHKLYKHFKNKMTPLDTVRLVQYGFKKDDKDSFKKVLELENYCMDFVSFEKGKASISEKKMTMKKLMGPFDLDCESKEDFNLFFEWYQRRFKPVFLTHCSVIAQVQNQSKPDLSEISDLKKEKALDYIDKAAFPEGPYDINKIPLIEDSYPASTSKQVADNIAAVKEELGLNKLGKKETGSKVGSIAGAAGVAAATGVATKDAKPAAKPTEGKSAEPEKKSVLENMTSGLKSMLSGNAGKVGLIASAGLVGGPMAALLVTAGVAGYSLIKAFGKTKLMPVDNVRLVQYGFRKDDQDYFEKVIKLEDYCKSFLVYSEGKMTLKEAKMEMKSLLGPFGLDPNDRAEFQQFFEWYQKRFKPVYLKHCAVMAGLKKTAKPDTKDISQLKLDEQAEYLTAVALEDGPYDITTLPVTEKDYNASTAADVKAVLADIRKMLGKFAKSGKPSLLAGTAKPAALQAQTSTEESAPVSEKAKTETSANLGGFTLKGKQTATAATVSSINNINKELESKDEEEYGDEVQMQALVDLSLLKQDGKIGALKAIKFKTYGLKELDKSKMKAIGVVEEVVARTMTYKNGTTDWEGSPLAVLDEVKGHFGITDKIGVDANNWITWFMKRFLPVYLKYVSLWCAYSGQKTYTDNLGLIKVSQQQDIAKQVASLSVWEEDKTPFPNYVLNKDSESVKENLEFLERTVKQETALEEKISAIKPATQNPNEQTQKTESATKSNEQANSLSGKVLNPDATQTGQSGQSATESNGEEKTDEVKPPAAAQSSAPVGAAGGGSAPTGLKLAEGAPLDGSNGLQFIRKQDNGVKTEGVNPAFLKQFLGMTEEFNKLTGKKITVTDGFRSYEDQIARKRKYGARAAAPGTSMHEFGLAMDADSKTLDEVDKLGLMRKYGFTRPVGGEPWHVEAIGTAASADKQKYKQDQSAATQAIEASMGRGGGGQGTVPSARKNSRNDELIKSTMGAKVEPIATKTDKEADASKPLPAGVQAKPGEAAATPGEKTASGLNAPSGVTDAAKKDPKAVVAPGKGTVTPGGGAAPVTEETKPTVTATPTGAPNTASKDINTKNADNNANGKALGGVKADLPVNPNVKVPQPDGSLDSIKKTVEAGARMVGVKPDIATSTVAIESGFNPNAKAKTTTASGLFQFLEGTWREMLNKHGSKFGKFGVTPGTSPFDPSANAIMGAQYIKDNEKILKNSGGVSDVNPTDIYAAHFLGPYGAGKLLKAIKNNPDQSAQAILPSAAASNKSIFYENGNTSSPKSVSGVYEVLKKKVETKAAQFGLKVDLSGPMTSASKPAAGDTPVDYGKVPGGTSPTTKPAKTGTSPGTAPPIVAPGTTAAPGKETTNKPVATTTDTAATPTGNNKASIIPPAGPKTSQAEPIVSPTQPSYDYGNKTAQKPDKSISGGNNQKVSEMLNVGQSPIENTYGFSPKTTDYNARNQMQTAQGFDSKLLQPTEKILTDSLKTQNSMLEILSNIFGLMSSNSKSKETEKPVTNKTEQKSAEDTQSKSPASTTYKQTEIPVKMRRNM